MDKEKNQNAQVHPLEPARRFISEFGMVEGLSHLKRAQAFFQDHFMKAQAMDEFDEPDYRIQFADHLQMMEIMVATIHQYSEKEFQQSIIKVSSLLDKKIAKAQKKEGGTP